MPRGQADYGIYTQTVVPAGIADPGEAAARLGSINVYDRRGWTVWMDDFEATTLRWDASQIAGGVTPVLDSFQSMSGSQVVHFECGASTADKSIIERLFGLIRLGKIGVEFWIQITKQGTEYFELTIDIIDGTNWSEALLRYTPVAGTIEIYTGGAWLEVMTGIYMYYGYWYFLPIKLVVDMDSDTYQRLLVGEREIDLSTYPLSDLGLNPIRRVGVTFQLTGDGVAITRAKIDNFILTQAEP